MGCNCRKVNGSGFIWTSADGKQKIEVRTEVEAKAKVIRLGGTYANK